MKETARSEKSKCTNEKPVLYTVESGAEIYKMANANAMNMCYPAYHTLDVEAAIDRLKEIE